MCITHLPVYVPQEREYVAGRVAELEDDLIVSFAFCQNTASQYILRFR